MFREKIKVLDCTVRGGGLMNNHDAITGILDEHPRTAIALRERDKKENYREFYEKLIVEVEE